MIIHCMGACLLSGLWCVEPMNLEQGIDLCRAENLVGRLLRLPVKSNRRELD